MFNLGPPLKYNLNVSTGAYFFRYENDSGENAVWYRTTPAERRFIDITRQALDSGMIPGPTYLNEVMGVTRRNNLGGRYSKIRRALFLGAGLREPTSATGWKWTRP